MAGNAALPVCACKKAAIVALAPESGSWICARVWAGAVTCPSSRSASCNGSNAAGSLAVIFV